MIEQERMAIIDVGSNSIRLVIYGIDAKRRYRSLYNLKIAARLSEYLNEEDALKREGFIVLTQVFTQFKAVLDAQNVNHVEAVATAAIRRATNQQDILQHINQSMGITIRVLSGEEEAYYGYLATINSTNIKDGLMFDMGGSSTEVVYFKNREIVESYSFPIGALTLAKMWNEDQASMKRIRHVAHEHFRQLSWLKKLGVPLIGVGGSVRQLAAVHRKRQQYPVSGLHQYEMTDTQLHDTFHYLRKIPPVKRSEIAGLSQERAGNIVPAGLFIAELMRHTEGKNLIISRKGLRDGILYDKLLQDRQTRRFVNVKRETIYQLMREFNLSDTYGKAVYSLARSYYHLLFPNDTDEERAQIEQLLLFSSHLRMLGHYIDEEHAHAHTLNVLINRSLDGFTHEERISLALLSSFTSIKRLRKKALQYKRILHGRWIRKLEILGAIIRMAASLYVTGREIIAKVELKNVGRSRYLQFVFHVKKGESYYFEQQHATLSLRQLERATKTKYRMIFIEEDQS